jgi:hypothetical protein
MVNNKKKSKKQKSVEKKVENKEENKEDDRQTKIAYDLFDNPMTRNIMKQLSVEEIDQYKKIGQELYGSINFEKSEILNNTPPFISNESIAYVLEGIKSGLHPKDLTTDETNLLKEVYGDEWYLKFNYTKEDLE